ncbi:MAG TPA: phage holin family protein [Candidatus Binatia bacterium]|nr:phage holin family protein [Candidatus Binatia bacterium]
MNSRADNSSQVTGALISGLLSDIGKLFAQDLAIAQLEIREGASRAKSLVALLAIGAFLAAIGFLMLIIALAHFISATTAIPLWAGYGIVGAAIIAAGVAILMIARSRAARMDMSPQRAREAVREDWLWMSSRINKSWQNVSGHEQH